LIWQAADARARGFLMAATAGRTTLLGEGLQHQDGHSLVMAATLPPCQAYDPAFAYEVATIVRNGLNRMYGPTVPDVDPDVFYYITLYNENYPQPPAPDPATVDLGLGADLDTAIMRGLYRWQRAPHGLPLGASIVFSGSAQGAARTAVEELANHWGVGAELWSATSYKALREDALAAERWNRLHPSRPSRTPLVSQLLSDGPGPVVAVSDYMTLVPEQVSRFVTGRPFVPLGTDGMGRSDTREALRRFFEIDAGHIVVAVLSGLMAMGQVAADLVSAAMARYDIDPDSVDPYLV
jgi:pyruvate dehydrogenase E1 component